MGVRGSKPQKQAQVLLLGLDGSGKTTMLYRLKYNESVMTVPTVGFNVETLDTDRSSLGLTVWDVGGQKKMRPHWRHYYADTAGLLFVVDSCDQKRMDEARKELHRILRYESLRGVPLVVLANKQDLRGALNPEDLCLKLDLRIICEGRAWFIQPCSARTGTGLEEDSAETDARGHQAEDEVKGTERHRGETSFALQQVMDGNLSRRLLSVVDSLSHVAVWSQQQREEDKTKRMATSGL